MRRVVRTRRAFSLLPEAIGIPAAVITKRQIGYGRSYGGIAVLNTFVPGPANLASRLDLKSILAGWNMSTHSLNKNLEPTDSRSSRSFEGFPRYAISW